MKNRFRVLVISFFLFLVSAAAGTKGNALYCGEMAIPRTVKVLSTKYFDILFSKENERTAKLLGQTADSLYLKAKQAFNCEYDFKTIVIISPDSDTLSVKYTASPYNRIVIFDAVGRMETSSYAEGMLDMFYHEVARAVSQSVRSELGDFLAKKVLGDAFQPAALLNVPYTFLEGAVYTEDEKYRSGLLYDNWNLQLLMQARIENRFPNLLQVSGAMDIYPGDDLCCAVAAAFYAYIQQKWGIEKFGQYWRECGKLNFFKLDSGIFYEVYGVSLKDEWEIFEQMIPLPSAVKDNANEYLNPDFDSNYKFVVSTSYGLVWYDQLKEEIDISGLYELQKTKELLFLASGVTNLTVSPCGRFLVVSHIQGGTRPQFEHDIVRLYDLKERRWISEKFFMRDGAIVVLDDGSYGIAGNSVLDGHSCLQIYKSHELDKVLGNNETVTHSVYSRTFEYGVTPYTPVALGQNHFACLICENNEWFVLVSDIIADFNDEDFYRIANENNTQQSVPEFLKVRNLRYADYSEVTGNKNDKNQKFCLLFDFVLQNQISFVRTGWIFFDQNSIPERTIIQSQDYYGGMNCGVMHHGDLYYVSQKLDHSEILYVPLNDIPFEEATLHYAYKDFSKNVTGDRPLTDATENVTGDRPLYSMELKPYIPWNYMKKGSWSAFMPVRDISIEEGVKKQPGLGVVFETQADPFSNNYLMLSGAMGFLPLDFTTIFNASEKTKKELHAQKLELEKDAAASVYFENTSTPADIIAAGVFNFNISGEYTVKAFCDIKFTIPLLMTFRRLTFDVSAEYLCSTTYWDITQTELFPNLSNWPSLKNAYKRNQASAEIAYSNIHQYGISPLKQVGVAGGIKTTSSWIYGQFNPYQINVGGYVTAEIPYLIPVQNYKNLILSLPTRLHAEVFYTNGYAVDAYAQILISGMEVQNGFYRFYFPRYGLYAGYNIALQYDTATVKLPDLRHFDRFYDVFGSCYLNDSVYFNLDFGVTPVIGKFSHYQLQTSARVDVFLRTKECRLNINAQIKF